MSGPRGRGLRGAGDPLLPCSIRSSHGLLMAPWPPQSPSRAGVPPAPPLTWMLTSSLHCLRVSRRSTSTLGTTWGGEGLSRRGTRTGGGTRAPGTSTHLDGADLLPPTVQHFEDGPEGAFGHEAQDLRGGTGAEHAMGMDLGCSGWGSCRGTEHPKQALGTHGDLEDPTGTPAGFMGTQNGAQGHGELGHRWILTECTGPPGIHAGPRWDATLRRSAEEPRENTPGADTGTRRG